MITQCRLWSRIMRTQHRCSWLHTKMSDRTQQFTANEYITSEDVDTSSDTEDQNNRTSSIHSLNSITRTLYPTQKVSHIIQSQLADVSDREHNCWSPTARYSSFSNEIQPHWCPSPFSSHSGCRKDEAQCVSAGVRKGIQPVKLRTKPPLTSVYLEKWLSKWCLCVLTITFAFTDSRIDFLHFLCSTVLTACQTQHNCTAQSKPWGLKCSQSPIRELGSAQRWQRQHYNAYSDIASPQYCSLLASVTSLQALLTYASCSQ